LILEDRPRSGSGSSSTGTSGLRIRVCDSQPAPCTCSIKAGISSRRMKVLAKKAGESSNRPKSRLLSASSFRSVQRAPTSTASSIQPSKR
jgi:hypothetical protein